MRQNYKTRQSVRHPLAAAQVNRGIYHRQFQRAPAAQQQQIVPTLANTDVQTLLAHRMDSDYVHKTLASGRELMKAFRAGETVSLIINNKRMGKNLSE